MAAVAAGTQEVDMPLSDTQEVDMSLSDTLEVDTSRLDTSASATLGPSTSVRSALEESAESDTEATGASAGMVVGTAATDWVTAVMAWAMEATD